MQVYVVRLGTSSLLVSAMTYGTALISIFWQLPAAALLRRSGRRMRWVVGVGLLYRLTFLLIVLVPFILRAWRAEATVGIWVLQAFPVALSHTAFLSMLADTVPAHRIPQVVGWRMATFGLTSTLSTLGAGWVLQRLPFPLSYQVVFALGFAACMVSWWLIGQLQVPDRAHKAAARVGLWHGMRETLRVSGFAHYALAVGVVQLAIGMTTPLLPLFWVRHLDATDAQISIVVTTASAATTLGSLLVRTRSGQVRSRASACGRSFRIRTLSAVDLGCRIGLAVGAHTRLWAVSSMHCWR